MPQLDLDSLLCGGGVGRDESNVTFETALSDSDGADEYCDADGDDDPYAPAESLRLRIGEDIDWSDVGAVLERDDSTKDSTKGATNPKSAARKTAAAARSSCAAAGAPKAVAVVIGGLPAAGKVAREHGRRRSCPLSSSPLPASNSDLRKYAGYALLVLGCGAATYYSFPLPPDVLHNKAVPFKYAPLPEDLHTVSNWSATHEVHTCVLLQPDCVPALQDALATAHKEHRKLRPLGSALSPNGLGAHRAGGLQPPPQPRRHLGGAPHGGPRGRTGSRKKPAPPVPVPLATPPPRRIAGAADLRSRRNRPDLDWQEQAATCEE